MEIAQEMKEAARTIQALRPDMADLLRKAGADRMMSREAFEVVHTALSIHDEYVFRMLLVTVQSADDLLRARNERFTEAFLVNMDRMFGFVREQMGVLLEEVRGAREESRQIKESLGADDPGIQQRLAELDRQSAELDGRLDEAEKALGDTAQEAPEWTALLGDLHVKASG